MSEEVPTEHLVKYQLPPRKPGGEPRFAYVNTIQLTGVYWVRGWRSHKDEAIKRHMTKLWRKKRPVLSKFFTPCKLWSEDLWSTYWNEPHIVISYGDVKHTFYMPNNTVAEKTMLEFKDTFWKVTV